MTGIRIFLKLSRRSKDNDKARIEATDIFGSAIATSSPSSIFQKKAGEVAVPSNTSNSLPVQTNSFFGNMLVENQDTGVWTHPYSVAFSRSAYYGLQIYHAQTTDRVFGSGNPPSYFYSPTGIKEFVFSSADFSSNLQFSLVNMSKFAATARFKATNGGYLDCPLVQGMGFVTGIYYNLIPQIYSQVGFSSVTGTTSPKSGILKYTIKLNNGTTWLLYITVPSGQSLSMKLKDTNTLIFSNSVDNAVFQLAFGNSSIYDQAAGCYPTNGSISATVSGTTCTYSLKHSVSGSSNSGKTLLFALPHHVASFDQTTSATKTSLKLPSTTKGNMTACLANSLTMVETIPTNMGFEPFTTISGKKANYTSGAIASIKKAASSEAYDDVVSLTDVNSMYTSGKILAKYALVLYTTHFILKDATTTNVLLPKMKTAIERFSKNKQQYPLFYDTSFKGVVSSATGGNDYGNGHYNDHHFHYGYHIHAAALTAKVDKDLGGNWLASVKDWVNTLVRDVANPSSSDTYFPVFRSFDFFCGHSWAKGLYASADGKDEESSSEDYNHSYAIKCWGNVIGDSNMENRGNLMLAIQRRSMDLYFLLKNDNPVQPSSYIPNRVAGITFENKLDHTTYFGTLTQYIQGIHMLPITPASSFVRRPLFVQQEWESILKSIVSNITDGWRGILMLNVALYDPTTAYNFFNSSSFQTAYLDNGMSKTWSLAYCAGVGASS